MLVAVIALGPFGGAASSQVRTSPHATSASTPSASPRELRILFVGNSYTHFHRLPSLVRRLIVSADPRAVVHVGEVTHSGWDLWRHWRRGTARRRIGRGDLTHVVLQGHSLAALHDPDRLRTAVHHFADVASRVGARTVLYETWARQDGDRVYREGDAAGPADMLARIDQTYRALADETGAEIAPVGPTFMHLSAVLPSVDLFSRDGSHPSQTGSFVAAVTLAARISGIDPRAITYRPYEVSPRDFDAARRLVADAIRAQ